MAKKTNLEKILKKHKLDKEENYSALLHDLTKNNYEYLSEELWKITEEMFIKDPKSEYSIGFNQAVHELRLRIALVYEVQNNTEGWHGL